MTDVDISNFYFHKITHPTDIFSYICQEIKPKGDDELTHIKCYPFGQTKGIVDSQFMLPDNVPFKGGLS